MLFTRQSRLLTTLRKRPFQNIERKGENAGNQHFLLFPQCFPPFPIINFKIQSFLVCQVQIQYFEFGTKICCMVKSLQAFSPFPTMFSIPSNTNIIFSFTQSCFQKTAFSRMFKLGIMW